MKGIGQYLDKFKNSAVQEIQKRTIVSKIIFRFTKQEVPIECISFINGIAKVKAQSGTKSEIYIKKKLILDRISIELPNIKISDIK